jgi:hypothetical protein
MTDLWDCFLKKTSISCTATNENATMFIESGINGTAGQVQLLRTESLILVLDTPKGMELRIFTTTEER